MLFQKFYVYEETDHAQNIIAPMLEIFIPIMYGIPGARSRRAIILIWEK